MVNGLHLCSAFLVLPTTQSTLQHEPAFIYSHKHWWQWLPCKVPPATIRSYSITIHTNIYTPMKEPLGAAWCSVSWPKTLWLWTTDLLICENQLYILSDSGNNTNKTGCVVENYHNLTFLTVLQVHQGFWRRTWKCVYMIYLLWGISHRWQLDVIISFHPDNLRATL